MKKIVTAVVATFLCAACHKSNSTTAAGFWTIAGTTYNANYVNREDTAGLVLLLARDTLSTPSHPANSIAILFGSLPAVTGSFEVLSQDSNAFRMPGPGQMTVFGSIADTCGPQPYCLSPYNNLVPWTVGPSATVKMVNGKINVVLPPLLARVLVCSGLDSLFVSANIREH